MKRFLPFLPVLPFVFALAVSGCTHAQAKTVPEGPPLDVPAPPPREIVAMEVEAPPPPVPAPEEPQRAAPARPRPAAPSRPDTAPVRPEAAPEAPKRADDAPRPAPSTTLQTTPSGSEGEQERSIRDALSHAAADLARVDYRVLNTDARSQYDTAKRFMQQADDAVRERNLGFAKNLADKAAALAAQLAGR